jgi:hypothetical protein
MNMKNHRSKVNQKRKYLKHNRKHLDMYPENYKILMKEIKEDVTKWRNILFCSELKNSLKMSILPKLICWLTQFQSKSKQGFL